MTVMSWETLLTIKRNNDNEETLYYHTTNKETIRSPFLRDADKITFSPYFRKLQDKTQVHPLAKSSYIRTRLTHSLEVATVGRSLGIIVGQEILNKNKIKVKNLDNNSIYEINAYDFAYIVQAASMAHDIGNPPFGHKGENVISNFYKKLLSDNSFLLGKNIITEKEKNNLNNFDGNAQGFRIISNIADNIRKKLGLRLTYPVLASFCKYPSLVKNSDFISSKKIGILNSEKDIFINIFNTLKIPFISKSNTSIYRRHPLSYLVEAADDICYCMADLQDAFYVGILSFDEIITLFKPFIKLDKNNHFLNNKKYSFMKNFNNRKILYLMNIYNNLSSNKSIEKTFILESLASEIINILIHAVACCFLDNEELFLSEFNFNTPILETKDFPFAEHMINIRKISKERIYSYSEKAKQELTGMASIEGVLKDFSNIAIEIESIKNTKNKTLSIKNTMINQIYLNNRLTVNNSLYDNFLIINDFIVECTDKNLIEVYQNINGIS